MKWHLKNIYAKLGVAGRDEAVSRLRDQQMGENGADYRDCVRDNPD
ncbi:helix-turn-helix transcriptional regulator [Alicycliphilus denitrificans]